MPKLFKNSRSVSIVFLLFVISYILHLTSYILPFGFTQSKHPTFHKPTVLSSHTTQLWAIITGSEPVITPSAPITPAYAQYSLFGYTSSYATVNLEGIDLALQTQADKKGYFEFLNFSAPSSIAEFCLNNIDTENLASPPLCVSAPKENTNQKYGPYLLPPTIKVISSSDQENRTNVVAGKTIPGTSVLINAFSDQQNSLTFIKSAYATNKKVLKVKTSSDGTYTTDLNIQEPGTVRFFSQSTYQNQKTPKSNTLSISLLSFWLTWLLSLYGFLKNLINLNNIILLQLLALGYLLWRKMTVSNTKNKRQLMIFEKHYLLHKLPNSLIKKVSWPIVEKKLN
jgi:hypothetical protein